MTCKDCIHYEACKSQVPKTLWNDDNADGCNLFKDKSRFIELPCKVGDIVYINSWGGNAEPHKVRRITLPFVYSNGLENEKEIRADFYIDEFNKTVFLTKEEAEKALQKGYDG